MTANLTKNAFPEERQPGDPDAVAEITELFREAGHPNPEAWLSHPLIQEAKTAAPKLQRFLVNRYWRDQLGALEKSTTPERFCLQDGDVNHLEYVKVFKQIVVPTIVEYKL